MKPIRLLFIISVFVFCSTLSAKDNKPHGLLTDLIEHTDRTWQNGYLSNVPIWETDKAIESLQYVQIASSSPSFSWIVPGKEEGTQQSAYRIIVSDSHETILSEKGNIWDSGMVKAGKSTAVPYWGKALQPEKAYFWRVKTITNTAGESNWSDIKAFRTASELSEYTPAFYPQVKTLERPLTIHKVSEEATFVDFGKDAFSQLLLTLTSESDNDSVFIHLGECAENNRVVRKPGGTIRYQQYPLALNKGTHTYKIKIRPNGVNTRAVAIHMPDYIGEVLPFRYCEIERYSKSIAPADVARETVHYPFDDSASFFQCNNDTLNQIWDLCKYSIKATSFAGIYVDGDRERIPYEADALINQLCHYGVDREYSMARRTHEYLLKYPTWPTEWILQAVLIAWYDYMYTGDSRSLIANYDILKARTLIQLQEKNGFISTTTGLITPDILSSIRFNGQIRDIVDWPHTGILGLNQHEGGEADGFVFTDYNAVTNAYHYETLKLMSEIAGVLNRPTEEQFYKRESQQLLNRFNAAFFDKKKSYYKDGITTNHSSLHANMFPMVFGMVVPERQNKVFDFIKSRGMACSVYGSQFLMDAIYEAADAEYGLAMLTKTDDRSWYNMIRVGSTISLEAWDNKFKPNQDWNHAWGAAPANIIPRKLMGVEPIAPGFDKSKIKPQPGSLTWAKAIVPTIKGSIFVEIKNNPGEFIMELIIPANMESDVYLPFYTNKYEIKNNGKTVKAKQIKKEPFIYVGSLPSGKHTISMKY